MELSSAASGGPSGLSIAAVERDTGLGKDTLRIWERRYGFPVPVRNSAGERLYPPEQVERLHLIRRLLDAGHRPGRVVPMDTGELDRMARLAAPARPGSEPGEGDGPRVQEALARLRQHDAAALRQFLARELSQLGLAGFVQQVVAPLTRAVGQAWVRGEIRIFEEHLYTEVVQGLLRQAIAAVPPPAADGAPAVLLATVPGEPHGLGLLMAEAFFVLGGCRCVSLGLQAPVVDIAAAAEAHRADLVALSFTGCMAPGQVTAALRELRERLPAAVALWAGGSAPVLNRRPPPGVTVVPRLDDVAARLHSPHAGGGAASDKTARGP